jgi:carbonic anhydrase/acetyltransferase-like protein (isoleucine patch superfamily)
MAHIIEFRGKRPRIADDVFLAPTAVIIGDVVIGAGASVWFGAVLRGDHPENPIRIGPRTSIQDNCVIHVGDWAPTVVGADVTVGHGAAFESCTIGDGCMIGMNAVILQDAAVGPECVVAAGAVVREAARIPERSVVAGVPAEVKKRLDGRAAAWIARGSEHYVHLGREYREHGLGASGSRPGSPREPGSEEGPA